MHNISEYLGQRLWSTDNMLFRGVSDSSYTLKTSIGRQLSKEPSALREYERTIFDKFKNTAIQYLDREPANDYEWLFLAQHYGIHTRLMDWTSNPLIALYFACEKNPDKECAVYKTLVRTWLKDLTDCDPFEPGDLDLENIYGVRPRHTNLRYINQSGVFTIHFVPERELEGNMITKYLISPEAKAEMRWQLQKLGINAKFVYPGLDSLAKDIVDECSYILDDGRINVSGNQFEP